MMRIAFYAPLKPPDHPSPSGDRRMARLLMRALAAAGHEVEVASTFRSYDGEGKQDTQRRLQAEGDAQAAELILAYREHPPHLWLTYHLYHKAPDLLGPAISKALAIPYVIAEASHAPKQENGPWALGHRLAGEAIGRADLILSINSNDEACVAPLIDDPSRMVRLRPFLDVSPYAAAHAQRESLRRELAGRHGLDGGEPWLLAAAMMRPGDKLKSYRVLAEALSRLLDLPWRLIIAGDGEARGEVEAAFAGTGDRVRYLGVQDADALAALYGASDLYLWPAVNEAYGMALLEAQAAGLPVIAGATGGVGDIVADGQTGLLTQAGDATAFAAAVRILLEDGAKRSILSSAALSQTQSRHGLQAASAFLHSALGATLEEPLA